MTTKFLFILWLYATIIVLGTVLTVRTILELYL